MGESRAARWLQILRWEAEGPPIEREAEVLMEVERERAKERLKTSSGGANPLPVERIPQAGKSRDIVGEKLGVSGEMVIPKRRLGRCLGWIKG